MRRLEVSLAAIVAFATVGLAAAGSLVGWDNLFATPDQRGRWLMHHGRYAEAAAAFIDPMWRGVALMRAGEFKQAGEAFGGLDTAEAAYDQGNALVWQGRYEDAIKRYDRALALRPGWKDAEANRTLARLRAEKVKQTGGDSGNTQKADEIVYDKDKKNQGGDDTEVEGKRMSDQDVRELWLKRVQTRPADFLRARFLYQLEEQKTP